MQPTMPRLTPIFAHQRCVGFLVSAGPRGVEAYDANEKSLGIFPNAIEAAVAIEQVAAAACPGCSE